MPEGEGGDPFAPSDAASGRESTDSLPPGGSPREGEHVAPLSQGGGEVGGARRSSLFLPPASHVGTLRRERPGSVVTPWSPRRMQMSPSAQDCRT